MLRLTNPVNRDLAEAGHSHFESGLFFSTTRHNMTYKTVDHKNGKEMQIHVQRIELESDESYEDRINKVRDSFYEEYGNQYDHPSSAALTCYIVEIYDGYVILSEEGNLFKSTYKAGADGKLEFQPRDEWVAVKQEYVETGEMTPSESAESNKAIEERVNFVFNELVSGQGSVDLELLRAIDGLAAGSFIAMNGMEVTFKPEELPTYVENTKAIIESTKTQSGVVVGLPIDMEDHDHKGGAGWLVDLEVDVARSIIRFWINWTEEGLKVIQKNLRRFFSPSTDPDNKVILGGSLTNQPGTRNPQGQFLLRPIELSQNLKGIDMTPTLEEIAKSVTDVAASVATLTKTVEGLAAKPPEDKKTQTQLDKHDTSDLHGISPEIQELLQTPEALDKMGEMATKQAEIMIADENRKKHVVDFASKFVGGTPERPYGIHVKAGDLVAVLLSLPEKQMLAVEAMLQKTKEGVIDFSERGITGISFVRRPKLDAKTADLAREWLAAKKDIGSFFKSNPELGKAEDYDLSEFIRTEEKV